MLLPQQKIMFLATVWSLFVSSLHAQSVGKDGGSDEWQKLFERGTFEGQAGEKLLYRLMSPPEVDLNTKYPIVLFLHGAGERGDDNQAQLVHGMKEFARTERREKFPCFVVAPQCPQNKKWVEVPWDAEHHEQPDKPSDPLRFSHDLIERLSKELPIDTDRIYITGLSMGGFGTFDALARWPDFFAAASPICGGGGFDSKNCRKLSARSNLDFSRRSRSGGTAETLARHDRSSESGWR